MQNFESVFRAEIRYFHDVQKQKKSDLKCLFYLLFAYVFR